ncbi:MAG: secretion system protein, partial [Tsuneonella sp.]
VNERDIKLPTDGFRAADEAARLFGMRDNAGVTGMQRPGPTAAQDQVPVGPGISQALPDAALPSSVSGESKRKKRRTAKTDKGAAAPGFSLQ